MRLLLSGILFILLLFPVFSVSAYGAGEDVPALSLKSKDRQRCVGQQTVFEVTMTGTASLTDYVLNWYKVGQALENTGRLLTLTNLAVSDTGRYYCRLWDKAADLYYYSDTAVLSIAEYEAQLDARYEATVGMPLEIEAAAATGANFIWQATPGHEVDGHIIRFNAFTGQDREEEVHLTVNYKGCEFRSQTILNITHLKKEVTLAASGRTEACAGESFDYTVSGGEANFTWQWFKGSKPIAGATSQTYRLEKVGGSSSGEYYCVAYDPVYDLSFSSDTLVLEVTDYQSGLNAETAGVIGEELVLTANPANGASFVWTAESASTPAGETLRFDAFTTPVREEKVKLETTVGSCVFHDSTLLKINRSTEKVNVRAVGITECCEGQSFSYTVTVDREGSYVYKWYKVNWSTPLVESDTYAFTEVTDDKKGKYFCTVYDPLRDLTFHSDTLDLKVYGYPKAKLIASSEKPCFASEVTLTALDETAGHSGTLWDWKKEEKKLVSSGGMLKVDMDSEAAVKYRAIADYHGCKDSAEITLTPIVPLVDLPRFQPLTIGEAVTLTNTYQDGAVYAWEMKDDYTQTEQGNSVTFTITPESDAVFLTVTYQGCSRKDTTKLEVTHADLDVQVKALGFTRVCVGDSLCYRVTVSEESEYRYAWYRKGSGTVLSTKEDYIIRSASPSDAGLYYCKVYDEIFDLTFYSDTLDVKVSEYPELAMTVNGKSQSGPRWAICRGEEVTLNMSDKHSFAGNIYLWTGKGMTITDGGRTAQIRVMDSAVYKARIVNNGCVTEDSLVILESYPEIALPEKYYAIRGEELTVRTAIDNPAYTYTWSPVGSAVPVSAPAYSFIVPDGKTTVSLQVTDARNCSRTVTTEVNSLPAMNYTTSVNDGFVVSRGVLTVLQTDTTICARSPLTLEVAYDGYDGYTYEWMRGETVVDTGRVLYIPSISAEQGGEYRCRVADLEQGEYLYSNPVRVTVKYRPQAAIVTPMAGEKFCAGIPVSFEGKDKTLAPANKNIYNWKGAGIQSGANSTKMVATASTNGYYIFTVAYEECIDTADILISPQVEKVDIPSDMILAQPTDQVAFAALSNVSGDSYSWYVNQVKQAESGATVHLNLKESGQVVVEMTRGECHYYDTCRILMRNFFPVEYNSPDDGFAISCPVLKVTQKEVEACMDEEVMLSVLYLGYDRYDYEWYKVGSPDKKIPGDSIAIVLSHLKSSDAGDYYCMAFNPDINERLRSDTLHLTVNAGPVANILITSAGAENVCFGQVITLETTVAFNAGGSSDLMVADRLEWTGEGIFEGQGTRVISAIVGTDPVYTLKAVKDKGCSSETSIRLNITKPEIQIPSVYYLNEPKVIEFEAKRAQMNREVTWSFNGVEKATSKGKVSLQLDTTGIVTALMVTEGGCEAWDSCRIYVKAPASYYGGEEDGFILNRPRPVIPTELKYVTVCPDSVIDFRVIHAEYPYFKYEWLKVGDDEVVFGTGKTFRFPVQPGMGGAYYCRVIDPALSESSPYVFSDTLSLTVGTGPLARITVTDEHGMPVGDGPICRGTLLTLDASTSASGVGDEVTYRWEGTDIVSEVTDFQSIQVAPEQTATYTVRVGYGGCSDTASVTFEVFKPDLGLPDRVQLASPDPAYVFDIHIPDDATVDWVFRPDGMSDIPQSGNQLNLTGDGWVFAYIQQRGCEAVDSCRVFVKLPETFYGGENDGFAVLEDMTTVWIEPRAKEIVACLDNDISLTAHVRGLSTYTFRWYRIYADKTVAPLDVTYTLLLIDHVNAQKAGSYFCLVTDNQENGSGIKSTYSTDTVTLVLKDGPLAKISFDPSTPYHDKACFGDKFVLVGSNDNPNIDEEFIRYSWEGNVFDPTTDENRIIARPQTDGVFVLKAEDTRPEGCADTVILTMQMFAPKVKTPVFMTAYEPGRLEIPAEVEGHGNLKWYIDYRSKVESESNPGVLTINQDAKVIAELEENGCSGFDTTFVYVKWPTTYAGGEDDGFISSLPTLRALVNPKYPEVCRGTDIRIDLRVNAEGRSLKYQWKKVGSNTILSFEKDLVMRANSMNDGGEYYCLVTDPAEENMHLRTISSDTATVTMINGPIAKISSPADGYRFCNGSVIEIDASATEKNKVSVNDEYTYKWYGADISYTGKQYIVNAVAGPDSRYIVEVSMGECMTYDTVTLDVYRPDIHIKPVVFLSAPADVELGVARPWTDQNTIKWHFYYDFDPSQEMTDMMVTADSVSYYVPEDARIVVERQHDGCSGYDTCHVFVKDVRSFAGGEEDGFISAGTSFHIKELQLTDYVCVGEEATILAEVVGNDFYHFEWHKVDNDRVYSDSSLCRLPAVTKEDEGYYYCIVTDVNNSISRTSERVYLHVKEKPVTYIVAETATACYDSEVKLEAEQSMLKEGVTYTYLWQGVGVKEPTAAVTTVRAENSGDYVLLVGDGDCYVADTFSLTVERALLQAQSIYHVDYGDKLTLKALLNGQPSTQLNWKVDGNPYRNVSEVNLTNLTKTIDFTVQTAGGCQVEQSGHIYVRQEGVYFGGNDDGFTMPNDLPQLLDQCDELLGCNVDTAVLWVNVLASEGLYFTWEMYSELNKRFEPMRNIPGKTNVSGIDTAILVFTSIEPEDEGRYRCCVGNNYGMSYSREIRLVKGGTPSIYTFMMDGEVCENTPDGFQFGVAVQIPNEGTRTGLHYEWFFGKDNINFNQLKPVEDYDYPSYKKEYPKEENEGYYMVKVSNYCGAVYDTAFQEIWEAPTFVHQPRDTAVCNWGSIKLTTEAQGGGTYLYSLWSVEVDEARQFVRYKSLIYDHGTMPEYTFDPATDVTEGYYCWSVWNGCDSVRSNPFFLDVEEEIIPKFEGIDTTVCAGVGGSLVLLASKEENIENPTNTLKYYWEKDGQRIEGSSSLKYTIKGITAEDAGVYICYAYHSCTPKQIKQYHVRTKSRPTIILPLTINEKGLCEGDKLTLKTDYMSDAGEVRCEWIYNARYAVNDNDRVAGSTTPQLTISDLQASDAGKYLVRLSNDCPGYTASNEVVLKVNMMARFTNSGKLPERLALCAGESKALSVATSGEVPVYYTWLKDGKQIQAGASNKLDLVGVTHESAGVYTCFAENSCNGDNVSSTEMKLEVITPIAYDVLGAGSYCGDEGREVTLSGFETGVIYTLFRRASVAETDYIPVKVVNGDTVSTPVLTFGSMEYGLYHVEAKAVDGTKTCTMQMNGEISITRASTPEKFLFHIIDPMCEGESRATVKLEGTENSKDIEYRLERWHPTRLRWVSQGSAYKGTGGSYTWPVAEGIYHVIAKNTVSGCTLEMGLDTVVERPYPQVYDLYAVDGDTTACFGMESDVVLKLKNSEKTCTYTLYKDGESTERKQTGNLIAWDKVSGGEYTVMAETNYGCQKEMGDVVVTDLPSLDVFMFTSNSGKVYCGEEAGQTHQIVLQGSTPGIRYDFYSVAEEDTLSSCWGTGGFLRWDVDLVGDAVYYVNAVDTLEGCVQEMGGHRVEIKGNHLELAVESPIKITASTQATLSVGIEGAMSAPVVTWKPESMIASVDTASHTATTRVLDYGERFWVNVQDDYCSRDTFIDVSVSGEPLRAVIKGGDCYTMLDTLFLCQGEEVTLCSYLTGGSGKYRFKWSDDQVDSIPVPSKSRISYPKAGDGYVVLYVESDVINTEGQLITQKATDTVRVIFRDRVAVPDFGNEALSCVLPGEALELVMATTEMGVSYQLEHLDVTAGEYVAVDGATRVGDGTEWRYAIPYTDEAAGLYRVKAVKDYPDDQFSCTDYFTWTKMSRAPQKFDVSAKGATTYCVDTQMDSIYVASSEDQVVYRLLRNGTREVARHIGDGSEFAFAGYYNSESPGENVYQVEAGIGECKVLMDEKITITSYERPVIEDISGMQAYCIGSSDVIEVTIPSPYQGAAYKLYKEGESAVVNMQPGSVDGVVFEHAVFQGLTAGQYYIVAEARMGDAGLLVCTDTVRGLKLTEPLLSLQVLGGKLGYCDNLSGYERLTLVKANPDLDYEVFDDYYGSAQKVSMGFMTHGTNDTIYYDGILPVTESISKSYYIHVYAGSCSQNTTVTIHKYTAPLDQALLGNRVGCIGNGLRMGIQSPEGGVTYTLYRQRGTEIDSLGQFEPGTNVFGTYSEEGIYFVMAMNTGGCDRRLTQEYQIKALPEFYKLYTPLATTYCEGEEGVELGITGTQDGVTYRLQKVVTVNGTETWVDAGAELLGTGTDAQLFSGFYPVGTYRIMTDYCDLPMLDTLHITQLPLPKEVALGVQGKACVDSTMQIRVEEPETGTQYVLCHEFLPTGQDTLAGNDVAWLIPVAAEGRYTVVADLNGCRRTLNDTVQPGQTVQFGDLAGMKANMCAEDTTSLYLAAGEWDEKAKYSLQAQGIDTLYAGVVENGQIMFHGIPAGHAYTVVASHLSCVTEKGTYNFDGIAIPVLAETDFVVEDCKPDGEATVMLKNQIMDYQYTLAGLIDTIRIKDFAGDTLISHLDNGSYAYTAYDTRTGCRSLPLNAVIRRAVPVEDTITSRLAYCPGGDGVEIRLSNNTFNVTYVLKETDGTTIDSISASSTSTVFAAKLQEGRYVFYRERIGLWGGCWLADTLNIEKYPMPSKDLVVNTPETLCETGTNAIEVANSEENVIYVLMNTATKMGIDTLSGNGGSIVFDGRKPEGSYQIAMTYKGLCPATYYKVFDVNPVPSLISASDGKYCYNESGKGNGTNIDVKDLKTEAEYVLYNKAGVGVDTLYGVIAGYFEDHPAGEYTVVGTYRGTGCSERVAEVKIHEITKPKVFTVSNAAKVGECGDLADVRLADGCEGDSVKYTLYMNDFFKMAGPVTAQNGEVKFGEFREVGAYKVYADKGDGTCGVWMDGSVIIYAPPRLAQLSVNGIDCGEGAESDVTISATHSVLNWYYYLSDGIEKSEVLMGGEDVLSWTKIGGHEIKAGEYVLYAANPCDSLIAMDTITVEAALRPAAAKLLRLHDGVICNGTDYELTLDKAETGVTYTITQSESQWEKDGVAREDFILCELNNAGLVTVNATVDTTGCTYFVDTMTMILDFYPQEVTVEGSGQCVQDGQAATLTVSLEGIRVPKTAYYLWLDQGLEGRYVDTIPAKAPATQKYFKPQHEYGCYTVVVSSITGHCNRNLDKSKKCLSEPPQVFNIVGGSRTAKVCEGSEETIELEQSEVGVTYYIVDGGNNLCSELVVGTGERLKVGTVYKPGVYRVLASVSDECSATMNGEVAIVKLPLPLLNINHYYSYPEGGSPEGVQVTVEPETSPGVQYALIDKNVPEDESWLDWPTADGGRITYDMWLKEGKYEIRTLSNTGGFECEAVDSLVIEKIKLTPFKLEVIGNPYKCVSTECRPLRLTGSEKGTSYSLFQVKGADTTFIALNEGTGKPISWGNQCDTGYFFVKAEKILSDGQICRSQMGDAVHLYVSTTIEKFRLLGAITGYCNDSEPNGKVILDSSQNSNITYKLYCNGREMPGKSLKGAGGNKLSWSGLEGLECVENNDVGNVYTVVATDEHCEVEMAGSVNIVMTNPVSLRNYPRSLLACTGDKVGIAMDAFGCLLSYEWTHDGRVVGNEAGYNIDSVGIDDMGVYYCKVSNYCGSVTSEAIELGVREVVTMPDGYMADELVCSDMQDVKLVGKGVGGNYSWYKAGTTDTISRERILELKDATPEDAGEYICYTWNQCGGIADTVLLEFNRVPLVTDYTYHVDTVCVNSVYDIQVKSRDSVVWYRNDVEITGKHDLRYRIGDVTLGDEGLYKIKAVNLCSEQTYNIVKLLVDDSIRIQSAPPASAHYCQSTDIRLEVVATPKERVEYTWWKRLTKVVSGQNFYTFPANITKENGAVYTVNYKNKCSEGSISHNVYVDAPVELAKMKSPDIVCSDATGDKVIIVKDLAQADNPEYDTYKWYKRTDGEPVLMSETDTLKVGLTIANRGLYYAEVGNVCGIKLSADVDLRIDTVPQILAQPQTITVCEGEDAMFNVRARGGDLTYTWYLRRKDGSETYQVKNTVEFESTSQWTIPKPVIENDSAQVWCMVENNCDFVSTDTVLLRITRNVRLKTDKVVEYLCANNPDAEVRIAVQPEPAIFKSWNYYVEKDGVLVYNPRSVYNAYEDTLTFDSPGVYRIFNFETKSTGCVEPSSEVTVSIENREIFTAVLSAVGKTTICRNDSVKMQVHIEGGRAPWQLEIRRRTDGEIAPELGGEPIVVYSRDTVLSCLLIHDEVFWLGAANQYQDPAACDGEVSGEAVFKVQQPYETRLQKLTPNHFGSCKTIDLAATFQPIPDVSIGKFYVNGEEVPDNLFQGQPGDYRVVYKTETSAGCTDTAYVDIHLDSLPRVKMYTSDSTICSGSYTTLYVECYGVKPFAGMLTTTIYKSDGKIDGMPQPTMFSTETYSSFMIGYDHALNWNDSLRVFQLWSLTDGNGCSAELDKVDQVKVQTIRPPQWSVTGIVTGVIDNQQGALDFVIPSGKEVTFVVKNEDNKMPWAFRVNYIDKEGNESLTERLNLMTPQEKLRFKDPGTYIFTMEGTQCSSDNMEVRTITVLDSGYMKVKACLQGAYDANLKCMKSWIFENGIVPLGKWQRWPDLKGRKGIDWVTVEVHEKGPNGKKVYADDYLLLSDGSIIDQAGRETLAVPGIDFEKAYYIVVRHRNHLPVGTKADRIFHLKADADEAETMDLRINENIEQDEIHENMIYVGRVDGISMLAMPAGNVLLNSLISMANASKSVTKTENDAGYYLMDVNLDGVVTLPANMAQPVGNNDVTVIYNNRDMHSLIKD